MANQYTVSEFISNAYALVLTKIFYNKARLIRRPVYLRGKSSLDFGPGLTIGHGCRFDLPGEGKKTLRIGQNCEFGDMVHIVAHERVEIGDDCLFASKIFISDTEHGNYSGSEPHSGPRTNPRERKLMTRPVKIGERVWLGENVCILSGVEVGDGCIIGANSVVTRNIPAGTIAVGSPAKVIKKWDEQLKNWINLVEISYV